jgi:hypothetical protein
MTRDEWSAEYGQPNWTFGLGLMGFLSLATVLHLWSDQEVKSALTWQFVYLIFGFYVWVYQICMSLNAGITNILYSQDVLERKNSAADLFVGCSLLAHTICLAGANVGDGPGPEAVFFCALLANGTLILATLIFRLSTGIADRIGIERDRGAALRFGLLMVALSLILAYAVAGPWESTQGTLEDFFKYACTVPIVLLVGIGLEKCVEWRSLTRK